ncbi:hypothetical protein SLE2022_014250 [Rubroshorea leprosula]
MSSWLRNSGTDQSFIISLFNYSFVNNEEETYVMFHAPNSSIFSRLVVQYEGTVAVFLWYDDIQGWRSFFVQLGDVCSIYARCGAYGVCNFNNVIQCSCLAGFEAITPQGLASGCVEKRKYQCGKEAGQGFLKLPNVKILDASRARQFGNLSLQECEQECLRDCNCIGYASTDTNGGLGCLACNDALKDMQRYKLACGQDFYLRVDELDLGQFSFLLLLFSFPDAIASCTA